VLVGTALNLAALIGIGMSGVTAYAATHQLHPLVVRSGSMEPTIKTGSMVLVRTIPAAAIRVGDVVAVRRPDGVTVTHRVQSLSRDGALAQLILKGDANKTRDPEPVSVASAGRLVWSAPVVGRFAAFTASARGGFLLGCIVTAVLLSLRRRSP
jgi:signal peptidase